MDIDPATWAEDAKHLAHYVLRLIGVMENTMRINIIKACILKRKIPRVGFMDNCQAADASARQLYMLRCQIDSSSHGPMLCKLQ